MTRVLLTGSGGFVGSHALEHFLVTTGWEIVCTDSFRHKGKTDRVREVLGSHPSEAGRVRVLTHDLRVPFSAQLVEEIGEVDYIVSVASESHVDRSIAEPRSFVENNVQLVLSLLEYARVVQPAKFLHVSTDEVYGPAPVGHDHSEGEPHRPSNPYSASKAAQESIVFSYWRTYGVPCGISNTMNIIGERQDREKFVPHVIRSLINGTTVEIHASPSGVPGSRFYLHARNQADALRFILESQDFPVYGDGVSDLGRWNVVGEEELNNLEMAELIAGYARRPLSYKLADFHSSRPGHDLRYALDGSKLAQAGWTSPIPLRESLRRTVEWTLAHPYWLL